MSKKLCFLTTIVLVLALSGAAGAVALDVNNGSFELDCDGNQIQRQVPPGGCIKGWTNSGDWFGAIIWCESPQWLGGQCQVVCPTDGHVLAWIQNNDIYAWQVTDSNYAANKLYTLLIDGQGECNPDISLFSGTDPDANEVGSQVFPLATGTPYACENWLYDLKVQAVVLEGDPVIGQPIGIKIFNPLSGGYFFMDNVRLEEEWATNAWDPSPEDGAIEVAKDVTLTWSPGAWVDKHRVYFSTSFADVNTRAEDANKGLQDPNWYSPGTLVLGESYFWAIDEVNESWVSGPVPPVNDRWKGDVWSFTVTGFAYNVYPADGAVDIPALNLLLRWTAGTDAGGHDVYFGSNEAAVEDANTNTAGIYRNPTQLLSDVNYLVPEDLDTGKSYFWRIDEVNTAVVVTGDVWSFTTGVFLIVDDMDSYGPDPALRDVWKDFSTGTLTDNGAELWIETADPNFIRDGSSMRFTYRNIEFNRSGGAKFYIGSEAEASAADLQAGTNWTIGGVKALVLYFFGDPCNGTDQTSPITTNQMWVAVDDGTTEGVVKYDTEHNYDMNAVTEASWHEWNINLADPCLAGVDMNNVAKVYIGFGGQKTGQTEVGAGDTGGKYDTVWFDDIRLYPPRCLPEVTGIDVLHALGDFTEDCSTDYLDLDLMATDWLVSDGTTITVSQSGTLTRFTNDPCQWVTGHIGSGALEFDGVDDYVHVDNPQLVGLTSMSITAWVKQTIDNEFVGIVTSREDTSFGFKAAELGIFGGGFGGPDGLGYDWPMGVDVWKHDFNLDVPTDSTWTFIAVVVDPTGASAYMKPDSSALQTGTRNAIAHPPLETFAEYFEISRSKPVKDKGFFQGAIDDVRIYGYNLSFSDINDLANETGEPNPPPAYRYEFEETSGLTAVDSGSGTTLYVPVLSAANITDPEAEGSRSVNFRDYAILANNWFDEILWPAP